MSSNIIFNGTTYSIPAEGDASWGNDLTNYLIAIASGSLQKTGGSFTLTSEANFGATYGLKTAYIKTQAANPASSGALRLGNAESVKWRNAANNADLDLTVTSSNTIQFNGNSLLSSGSIVNADVSPSAAIAYSKLNLATSIVDADISNSAAIAYSKLNLATSILNSDISASAAIAYSKLNLATSIVNADISASAAIAYSKLNIADSDLTIAKTSGLQTALDSKLDKSTLTTKGDLYVATASAVTRQGIGSDGQVLTADSTQANGLKWADAAGGGEGVNFISNGKAETSNIFSQYNDSSTTRPVDGTGGTASNLSSSVSATTPLAGTQSFLLTKSGSASTQGMGWSVATATIDPAYRAKVLQIEFDYIVNSGTFVAGSSTAESDVIVYIYDVTNSTLIEPSSIKLLSNSTTISDKFVANFQTSATGSSYRLIFHCQSSSTANYSLKIDNVKISPCNYVYGTPITDWVSWTPTGTWTGAVAYTGYKRRVGSNQEYRVKVATSGAPTGTTLSINLAETIDTTKISSTDQYREIFGDVIFDDTGTGIYYGKVAYNSSTSVSILAMGAGSTYVNGTTLSASVPFTYGVGDSVIATFTLPIQGWSSSTQQSDGYDGRLVAARYTNAAGTSIPTSIGTAPWATKDYDTTGSFSSDIFTAPSSGIYEVSLSMSTQSQAWAANSYFYAGLAKNGTSVTQTIAQVNVNSAITTGVALAGTAQISLVAGDTLRIRYICSDSGHNLTASSVDNWVTFKKLQAPTTISATEKVVATYKTLSSTTITSGTALKYTTKVEDSHGSYNTSTGAYVTSQAGTFSFSVGGSYAGTPTDLQLYVNGVSQGIFGTIGVGRFSSSIDYPLNADDSVTIVPNGSTTAADTVGWLMVKRIK